MTWVEGKLASGHSSLAVIPGIAGAVDWAKAHLGGRVCLPTWISPQLIPPGFFCTFKPSSSLRIYEYTASQGIRLIIVGLPGKTAFWRTRTSECENLKYISRDSMSDIASMICEPENPVFCPFKPDILCLPLRQAPVANTWRCFKLCVNTRKQDTDSVKNCHR